MAVIAESISRQQAADFVLKPERERTEGAPALPALRCVRNRSPVGSRPYAVCVLVIAGGLCVHDVSAFLVVSWIGGVAMKLLVRHSYSVATQAAYIGTSKKHAAHSLKLIIVFTRTIHCN